MSDIVENSASSLMARLREPFPSTNLSCRADACNSEKTRRQALRYIEAHDVQNRLDEVLSPQNWCNELEHLAALTESQRRRLDALDARLKGRKGLPAVRDYMLTGAGAKELPDWACIAAVAEIDRLGNLRAQPLH